MNKNKKLGAGLIVVGGLIFAGKVGYNRLNKAFIKHCKKVESDAIDKTVDSFVTAVVTCKELTIESKHHGSAKVRLVVDR